jgi:hypothetical protein
MDQHGKKDRQTQAFKVLEVLYNGSLVVLRGLMDFYWE